MRHCLNQVQGSTLLEFLFSLACLLFYLSLFLNEEKSLLHIKSRLQTTATISRDFQQAANLLKEQLTLSPSDSNELQFTLNTPPLSSPLTANCQPSTQTGSSYRYYKCQIAYTNPVTILQANASQEILLWTY